jgi:hypothetical protein
VNTEFRAELPGHRRGSHRRRHRHEERPHRREGLEGAGCAHADDAIPQLEPHVAHFSTRTWIRKERCRAFPSNRGARLRKLTKKQLIVAGGIRSQQEVDALDAIGADAVVGMAVYTELLAV